ncbi:hypothetical protein TRFO_28529 [Tritrichomonas foetus]|uniref:Vacuolar import/degradation Vid27 C-terminal domain-containing protein n=1 Tax=Tritrichomonas foetus TaxID=1144522 RepID=A0A1J4JYH3_9EUKA|nr:hypothetical protein TRFO_28529 [Tritrichomonas foetus]|eukprot:OHT04035.1 hypothetical protein TRFO_28529 [Tritrichomonas foetus]
MSGTCIVQAPVSVYQYNNNGERLIGEDCCVRLHNTGNFTFTFDIIEGSTVILSADIVSALNLQFSLADLTLYFDIRFKSKLHNLKLIFHSVDDLRRYINIFVNSLFEHANKNRVSASDIPDIDNYIESLSLDNQNTELNDDDDIFDDDEQAGGNRNTDGGHNFLLRVGPRTDNTMVMRKYNNHCDLGLFTNDRDCQFRMALPTISDESNQALSANDMLTNNNDHGLFVLDNQRPYEVFNLNLDRGMVVNHLDAIDSSNQQQRVDHILHTNYGDSSAPTFVGFNNRNTMLFDTRVDKPIVNRSDYKTDNKFTCGVTTRTGRFAMGSDKGIVRLYKEPCKTRATVNFQVNIGDDPIIGLDVSPDEQWIVATCPYYVSVFTVLARSTGKLAFDAPMKQDKSPVTRLTISQRDQQRIAQVNGGDLLPFTSAKFESKNGKVVAIVASMGNALISWNFRAIENNRKPQYSITFISGEAIIDNQPFDQTSDILYMSPNQVSVAQRQQRRH